MITEKELDQLEAVGEEMSQEFSCYVPDIDRDLACDCVEEFIADGKTPMEVYVAWMIGEGYDMEVFS